MKDRYIPLDKSTFWIFSTEVPTGIWFLRRDWIAEVIDESPM
jgi:hypothetical protein